MSPTGESVPDALRLRRASARARGIRDGITAAEAFSRGDAIERDWMGWGVLRVLSRQDWAPGALRDEGRVANMERLLLVLDGALDADCGACGRHRVDAGGALWIGSGHGLASRLANASGDAALRLVELWLRPDRVNAAPAVAAWSPGADGGPGHDAAGWSLVARGEGAAVPVAAGRAAGTAPDAGSATAGGAGTLPLRQAADVLLADPRAGTRLSIPAFPGRRCWLEVLAGDISVERHAPAGGDAGATEPVVHLAGGDGLGWLADAAGAPAALLATGDRPARLLLLVLPA